MSTDSSDDVTQLLRAWGRGEADALERPVADVRSLALEDALHALATIDPGRVKDWKLAKRCLQSELKGGHANDS